MNVAITCKSLSRPDGLFTDKRTGLSAISKKELTRSFWFGDVRCDVKVLQYIWTRKKHPQHQAPAAMRPANRLQKKCCPDGSEKESKRLPVIP